MDGMVDYGTTYEDVLQGEPIQPQTEQWLSVGRKLLEDSIQIGRDYSKFMIQFSFGAIPIYIVLLQFVKGDNWRLATTNTIFYFLVPILLMLVSSALFIIAYYPKRIETIVGVVEGIQLLHEQVLKSRRRWNFIGTVCYMLSIVLSTIILIYF